MADFAYRRMHIYRDALALARDCDVLAGRLTRSRWHAGHQLSRASLSIVLNTAEGCGEFRPLEKARFYRMARRSAFETAACLDYLHEIRCLADNDASALLDRAEKVAAGLTSLIGSMYRRANAEREHPAS